MYSDTTRKPAAFTDAVPQASVGAEIDAARASVAELHSHIHTLTERLCGSRPEAVASAAAPPAGSIAGALRDNSRAIQNMVDEMEQMLGRIEAEF